MPDMDDIYKVHENLYIGAFWPQINFKKLKKEGITAIVNLMEESHYDPRPLGYIYLHRGFPDECYVSHSILQDVLDFIDKHIKKGKVLVHCAMGISRSASLIIAWLLKENIDWNWNNAVEYVNKSHLIFPAVEIRESILDYFENLEGKRRES